MKIKDCEIKILDNQYVLDGIGRRKYAQSIEHAVNIIIRHYEKIGVQNTNLDNLLKNLEKSRKEVLRQAHKAFSDATTRP